MKVDGPLADAMLRQAVRGEIEDVPAFNSISYEGVVHRCVAFCRDQGKDHGLPLNAWATALWQSALRHKGYVQGLRREDGTVADRLVGNVVVVFEEKASRIVTTLAQSYNSFIERFRERPIGKSFFAEAERLFNR